MRTVNVGRRGMNGISSKVDLKLSSDKERSGKLTGGGDRCDVYNKYSYLLVCDVTPIYCAPRDISIDYRESPASLELYILSCLRNI